MGGDREDVLVTKSYSVTSSSFRPIPKGEGEPRTSNIGDSQLFRGPNLRRSVRGVVVSLHLKIELSTIYKQLRKRSASAQCYRAQESGAHTPEETSVVISSNTSCFLAPDLVKARVGKPLLN